MTPRHRPADDVAEPRIRVLQVLNPPDSTTQYVDQVVSELPDWVSTEYFSWRRGLLSSYDVLHVHWPEHLVRGTSRRQTVAKQVACAALLLRMRLRRVAFVRTEHNIQPHERGGVVERAFLRWMQRWTTLTIRLNHLTPPGANRPAAFIRHGDYRGPFAGYARPEPVPGRLLYFGIIRDYKGVPQLLDVFRRLAGDDLSLRLVGKPATPQWRTTVEEGCRDDDRVTALLEFVSDEVLVDEVCRSELVVLPYREMYNSGALLVALSLQRPVLVPRSPVNTELADEVGPGWVHQYDGDLTPAVVSATLAAVRSDARAAEPDLSRRDWTTVGALHAGAYRQAVTLARRVTHARPLG